MLVIPALVVAMALYVYQASLGDSAGPVRPQVSVGLPQPLD
jgi:hypothetical protein